MVKQFLYTIIFIVSIHCYEVSRFSTRGIIIFDRFKIATSYSCACAMLRGEIIFQGGHKKAMAVAFAGCLLRVRSDRGKLAHRQSIGPHQSSALVSLWTSGDHSIRRGDRFDRRSELQKVGASRYGAGRPSGKLVGHQGRHLQSHREPQQILP